MIAAMAALVILAGMAGCRKQENADAEELLKTIPSSASFVAVANIGEILEEAGCKVDDGKVSDTEQLRSAISRMPREKERRLLTLMLDGESGVEPSVSAFFAETSGTYNAGILADPGKFKALVEKETGQRFTDDNGCEVAGNIAVKGNRYWMHIYSNSIDAATVNGFASLNEKQSFLSNPYGENLREVEDAIEGWGNIQALMGLGDLDFQTRAVAQVGLQTIFKDAENIRFDISFDRNEMKAEVGILDSKGRHAKLLYPVSKVDVATVREIGGNAEVLMAMAIPNKFVSGLIKATSGQGASMLGIYAKLFSCVDGTTAFAATNTPDPSLRGVISTTGENTTDLSDMLNRTGLSVVKEGKQLKLTKGTVTGAIDVATAAERFKDAAAGVIIDGTALRKDSTASNIKDISIALAPYDGSLRLVVKAFAKSDKDRIILSLFK